MEILPDKIKETRNKSNVVKDSPKKQEILDLDMH